MKPTFDTLLKEFASRHSTSAPPDALVLNLFREGDVAHLKRWLDDGGAAEIWEGIHPHERDNFTVHRAFGFIAAVLRIRHVAEKYDTVNKEGAELWRQVKKLVPKERKRILGMLKKGEISPEEYATLNAVIDEASAELPTKYMASDFSVRSDKEGTRKRTIFCRVLSDMLHDGTGRWHDAEVARLCEIAFGGGDVTSDMVRSAREAGRRDATRKR